MFTQQFFDQREQLAVALADDIASHLAGAITARGAATMVVSGGSSPLATFRALAARDLDWSKVTLLPSDERWVAETGTASNAGMIRRELLRDRAAAAAFLSLYDDTLACADAPAAIAERVDALARPFDYVLLGMGEDGHVASLFPDDPAIAATLASHDSVVMACPPSQSLARISLTPRALLDARHLSLLFFGQHKADVFAAACASGDPAKYPVCVVLRQERVPLTTFHAL